MMRILQINLGVGQASQGLMEQVAKEIEADVMVVSEPYRNKGEENAWYPDSIRRAAVAVTDRTSVENTGHPDRGFRWMEFSNIRLYSCYWPPHGSSSIAEFSDFLDRLDTSIRGSKMPVIAAGDFNAKSGFWGSNHEDARGALLTDLMSALNMTACNQGNNPTFVRGHSETHIDITFASSSIVNRITNWRVLEEESLSLHKYIAFDVLSTPRKLVHQNGGPKWSWRKQNEVKLREYIDRTIVPPTDYAQAGAEALSKYLVLAYDSSMLKSNYRGNKKQMHWWTKEIADLRKKCLSARRKLKRANRMRDNDSNSSELLNYRESQKALKIEIEKSKNRSWKVLCRQVDVDPWGLPYKIVTKKLIGRKPIPGITVPGRIERIVEELFPTKNNIIWHTQQEKLTFLEVTISEVKECAKKIPSGKAPGPDEIPDVIVKMVAAGRPNAPCKTYNSCFEEAYFPEAWKVAKLVLLRKGNKPLEQPSSYRPICWLNTVGKFFERVIKRRLEL